MAKKKQGAPVGPPPRIVSYGGGVQSTALLVLAAEGKIDYTTFVFANTGDNAENPETLDYVRDIAVPYAEAHGLELIELKKIWRDGRDWSLYDLLIHEESRSIGLPIRMSNGAPGNRACTIDFKIRVIAKWLKQHGATPENKGMCALGISVDEFHRAKTSSRQPHYDTCHPLIDMRLDRAACQGIIARAGLFVPPKSSCWFCPYHSLNAWKEMKRNQPEMFDKAVDLERHLNYRREKIGKNEVYLTNKLVPLDQAVGPGVQPSFFDDVEDSCESGYCMI